MRDLFTRDLGWKLFSLFLAAAIWFTVNRILHEASLPPPDLNTSAQTYDNLPITVVSAAADVHDFRVTPLVVKVTVTGAAETLKTIQADEIHAIVNLTGADLGREEHLPVEIYAPTNVTVTGIDPARVLVIMPPAPGKKP
jgi:YbbR domain-containing protein